MGGPTGGYIGSRIGGQGGDMNVQGAALRTAPAVPA
jgi:hypothetical protein